MSGHGADQGGSAHSRALADRPDRAQAIVLGLVLHGSACTTEEEIVREVTQGEASGAEVLELERAIGDLVGFGLLHRCGGMVSPSRAARQFHRLNQMI